MSSQPEKLVAVSCADRKPRSNALPIEIDLTRSVVDSDIQTITRISCQCSPAKIAETFRIVIQPPVSSNHHVHISIRCLRVLVRGIFPPLIVDSEVHGGIERFQHMSNSPSGHVISPGGVLDVGRQGVPGLLVDCLTHEMEVAKAHFLEESGSCSHLWLTRDSDIRSYS
jgi:hypothetical protein